MGLVSYTKTARSLFLKSNNLRGLKVRIIWQPFSLRKRLKLNSKTIDWVKGPGTLLMSTKFSTRINPLSKRLRIRSSTTC
jgi:hypothetical protein